MRGTLLSAAIAMAGIGCTVLFPVDELTGGTVGSNDAAAPLDSGVADAATDSGTDAGTSYCPTNAYFCDDFERNAVFGGPWENIGGTPVISTARSVSGTRSLLTAFDPAKSPDFPNVFHTVDAIAPKVTFRVAIRMDAPPPTQLEMLKLAFGEGNNWDTVLFFASPSQIGANISTYKSSPGPVDSRDAALLGADTAYGTGWHVYRIDVDTSSSTKRAVVRVDDGAPVMLSLASVQPVATKVAVSLGLTYGDNSAAWKSLYFDDAAFSPTP